MKWIFVVIVLLCLFVSVGTSAEFEDTVQNHWDMDSGGFGNYKDLGDKWNISGLYCAGVTITADSYLYNMQIRQYENNNVIRTKYPCMSNYWSWTVTSYNLVLYSYSHVYLILYDSELNVLMQSDIDTYIAASSQRALYEIIITEGNVYLQIDGVSQGSIGTCSETPSYLGVNFHMEGFRYMTTDDYTTNEGIVGIGAEPCTTGTFQNHTIVDLTNSRLDMSWHVKTIPIDDYNAAQYDIKVKRATWDEWYNVTRLKDAGNSTVKPHGNIVYNWTDVFNGHYGLYLFELYKTETGEPEVTGQDFIYYNDVGEPSTINIEDTEYAIGESMNISYYIDSPDFGANQYKIQIFDATGQLKDERVLTQQAATEQITSTIDWEEGLLYAVLVKDTKPAITEDPPEDIIDLAYDFCTLSNVIYITGKVYDASNADNLVGGTLLDNVSLNWIQAGTIYNTTSDANGEYVFLDATTLLEVEWFQDVSITVHAEKTNYTHSDFDMTIIKAGRYTVDIYMVPPQRAADLENASVAGVVADDIFHQCIPFSRVDIWNATWSNATYTNAWGWYEFTNISNGTYNMKASKETYRDDLEIGVEVGEMSIQLEACDVADYNEATLDKCDATTNWYSDNALLLDTSDYIEGSGSLVSNGTSTKDFNKTFSPGVNSNITGTHGYFYFYAKVDNHSNISSTNVTITISSNVSGATDKLVWQQPKGNFNTTWDLHMLKIANATETGTCNLSNITYFKFESTKSGNVITKIDFLAFIEYIGWTSCVDLSIDTSDKQEGTGSLKCVGTPKSGCDLVVGKWWSTPFDASVIDEDSEIARLQFWNKESNSHTTIHYDNVYLEDADGDYLYWMPFIYSNDTWQEREFFLTDATEYGTFDISSITWLGFYNPTHYYMTSRFDDIRLVQAGQTRQNFFLRQYYDLTVYAKDADTRFTITDFTAILDSTNVKETTTGSIIFTNITYAIYPLEVSSDGYYTNKQYVFMGQDTEQIVYLTKIEDPSGGEGVGQYYAPPHLVEFRVENIWGRPYENVNINITAQQTTMGAWSWLASVFGYRDEIAAEIQNGSMSGTTDTYGAMSFMMTETIKYKIHVYNATQGIDKTVYVYPKEERYIIVCSVIKWQQEGTEEMRELTINVTSNTINDTHANITIEYDDPSNATIDLTFYVNRTTNYNKQENVGMYNVVNDSNVTHSFTVTPISGRSFFVRVVTENSEWGTKTWDFAVKFHGLRFDLGLPSIVYPMIAIALIIFTGGLFGASSATQGSLICCLEGWIFLGMGWFSSVAPVVTMTMALSLATVVSILAIIIEKGRRTGVQ